MLQFDSSCDEALFLRNEIKRQYYRIADEQINKGQQLIQQFPSDPENYIECGIEFSEKKRHS